MHTNLVGFRGILLSERSQSPRSPHCVALFSHILKKAGL